MGDEDNTKENEVKTEEKKERKIYKGEVLTVEALSKRLQEMGVAPIQPMNREYKHNGVNFKLPPTFVVTKFAPAYKGFSMHYVAAGQKAYRDVPADFELNLLQGRRGADLESEWKTTIKTNLRGMTRRIGCTIGTDPEIFVVNQKDEVIPAWTYISSKSLPEKFKTADGAFSGTAYWDGFQAEFTTPGILTCLMQLGDVLQAGMKTILNQARLKNPKAKLTLASVLTTDDEVRAKADEKHVEFGCAPSKNVYGLTGNKDSGRVVPYRFAGGHIHMGLRDTQGVWKEERIVAAVRALDSILGVACVSLFANQDNPIRRQYYGQAGEYRTPAHGLEYRVLSNAWLAHPLIFQLVFDLARAVVGLQEEGLVSSWDAKEAEVVETIMNHDVDTARAILKRNADVLRALLYSCGGVYQHGSSALDVAQRVWTGGMEEAVADPGDIEGNWKLTGGWTSHSGGPTATLFSALSKLSKGGKV